jgi:hypothetical protein
MCCSLSYDLVEAVAPPVGEERRGDSAAPPVAEVLHGKIHVFGEEDPWRSHQADRWQALLWLDQGASWIVEAHGW